MTTPTTNPVFDSPIDLPPTPDPGPATRRLWLAVGGTLAAFILAYGSLVLVNLLAVEATIEPLVLDDLQDLDQVTQIRIDASSGSVEVTGVEPSDGIEGELRVRRDLWRPDQGARIEGATLVLESDCPTFGSMFCRVDYQLTVPIGMVLDLDSGGGGVTVTGAGAALDLHSSGGGITVRDAAGPITAESSGGGVEVIDSGGDLDVRSSGGFVRVSGSSSDRAVARSSGGEVSLSFAQPPSAVEASSSGGRVLVRLPRDEDISYDVDVSSSGGGTGVEVRTDPSAERTVVAHSSGGRVDVVYSDDPTG